MAEPSGLAHKRVFQVKELVGRGGHARVYRAEMKLAEGPVLEVALKVFDARSADKERALSRFRDEAHLLASLRHRAIVGMKDLMRLEPGWTIVLEWVPGADVAALVSAGPAPPAVIAGIGAEIADALDHAWRSPAGVDDKPLRMMHRDISAKNIRITPDGDVKLLDFGLARADVDREANTTQTLGVTRAYAAPERFSVDAQSLPEGDVFSLGLVMLDLFRGSSRHTDRAVSAAVRADLLQALERERSPLPRGGRELIDLIKQMTEITPSDRPTARQVGDRCAELAITAAGPRLRAWAAKAIDAASQRTSEVSTDSWVGRNLSETSPSDVVVLEARRPLRRWVPVVALAGVLTAVAIGPERPRQPTWITSPPADAEGTVGAPEWLGPAFHLRAADGARYRAGRVPRGSYDVAPDDGGTTLCQIDVQYDPVMLAWDAENLRCLPQ